MRDGAEKMVVANCHKVPADKFNRRLLEVNEVEATLSFLISAVFSVMIEILSKITGVHYATVSGQFNYPKCTRRMLIRSEVK